MVKSLGVKYVLAGHSERRTLFKDNDAAINKKVLKIIESGMIPVLCIGETKEEFDANLCEPVWAIGTGLVCVRHGAEGPRVHPGQNRADVRPGDGRRGPHPVRRLRDAGLD